MKMKEYDFIFGIYLYNDAGEPLVMPESVGRFVTHNVQKRGVVAEDYSNDRPLLNDCVS